MNLLPKIHFFSPILGEMAKFNMFPKSEALHCMKMLMFDFTHHNIEMACSLLESCGRFLYRSPESHHRTKVYLVRISELLFYRDCSFIRNASLFRLLKQLPHQQSNGAGLFAEVVSKK